MFRTLAFALAALALLLALPLLLRLASGERLEKAASAGDRLVVLTSHNETVRREYDLAFRRYYRDLTGREVELDFRSPGGSSEIMRYIADRFQAEFRREYERDPDNPPWDAAAAGAFANPALDRPGEHPEKDLAVRRKFLASGVGIGVDVFAGGGIFDQRRNAESGFAVDGGVAERHPEYLDPRLIPQNFGGDDLFDPAGRYYGVVLSTFGICANADRLRELNVPPPRRWADLGDGKFFDAVALADPTKSGSANKCFEIIVQQQMAEAGSPGAGWRDGLNLIKRIVANSRVICDSAGKVPHEVSTGNSACGMAIDTYGLAQEEWNALQFGGRKHFFYITPQGGTAVSADPVQILRGAPHRETAEIFVDFLLSEEGQKLHAFLPGTPGGPEKYALRRPPIRRDIYAPEYAAFRSDPDYNPYRSGADFVYRPQWTAPYYTLLRVLIRSIMLEPRAELHRAWGAIIAAGGPEAVPEAMAAFDALPFEYELAAQMRRDLRITAGHDAAAVAALCRRWSESARANYLRAEALALEGR